MNQRLNTPMKSFVGGTPSKPASGVIAEKLEQIIISNLRRIGDAFDQAVATGLSSDLHATYAAVIVDARTRPGRGFLCHVGCHGPWGKTDFPVVILPRSDLAIFLAGCLDNVLLVPPKPGKIVVIAIGAGTEADSVGIATIELGYRRLGRFDSAPALGTLHICTLHTLHLEEHMTDKEDEVSSYEGEARVKHLEKITKATELAVRRVAELNALDPSPRHLLADETSNGIAKDADTVMRDAKRNEQDDPEGAAVWLRLHEVVAEYATAVKRHERAAS